MEERSIQRYTFLLLLHKVAGVVPGTGEIVERLMAFLKHPRPIFVNQDSRIETHF